MYCAFHGKNMIDTHPDILNSACSIFFYPRGEHGCKNSRQCSAAIRSAIKNEDSRAKNKHEEYLASIEHLAKK